MLAIVLSDEKHRGCYRCRLARPQLNAPVAEEDAQRVPLISMGRVFVGRLVPGLMLAECMA